MLLSGVVRNRKASAPHFPCERHHLSFFQRKEKKRKGGKWITYTHRLRHPAPDLRPRMWTVYPQTGKHMHVQKKRNQRAKCVMFLRCSVTPITGWGRVCLYFRGPWTKLSLRVHKFAFQWDLLFYLVAGITSLFPFAFSGQRILAVIPLSVWALLNLLFLAEDR